jgi:hypothetical protein
MDPKVQKLIEQGKEATIELERSLRKLAELARVPAFRTDPEAYQAVIDAVMAMRIGFEELRLAVESSARATAATLQ